MRNRFAAIEVFAVLSLSAVALAFQSAARLAPSTHHAVRTCVSAPSVFTGRLNEHTTRGRGHHGREFFMMARSNRLKSVMARQKKLERSNAPVILSEKARRGAKRERRAYFRERYACSGRRLIKLQQEDPDAFYIGFIGTNRAGRAQALVAVEAYLKRATELKVKPRSSAVRQYHRVHAVLQSQ